MTVLFRACALLLLISSVAACSVRNPMDTNAPDSAIAAARYSHDGPTRLTLFTMISNSTGNGAHTSLMINASERVAFDPAGSFRTEGIAAKNDVVYGMTPYMVDQYTRFHARETFHVVVQSIDVPPAVAQQALVTAQSLGPVLESHCALTTSHVLQGLAGFEDAPRTYSPKKLMGYFAEKGASYDRLFEYDDADKSKVLAAFVPEYERDALN